MNPQFPVIGADNTFKAVCLNGKTSATGTLTSPTLTGGISKLVINYTKMFTDTALGFKVTITDLATGVAYTDVESVELPKDEKYVVYNYEFVLETAITGDFTIVIENTCPSATDGNKDRVTLLNVSWYAPAESDIPTHTHSYTETVTQPTCTEAGYTTYTCECGDTYTGNEVAAPGHDYDEVVTAPTCTAAGYTEYICGICDYAYTVEGEAATGHNDNNGDYKCDTCSTKVLPADGEALTLAQAIAIANLHDHNTYTTNKYYITVEIVNVYNTQYGNANVTDADGNEFVVYGLYTWNKAVRYDAMDYKPVTGDEITVYGVLGKYNSTLQMKDAWLDEVVAHTHSYKEVVTAPTCGSNGYTTYTCNICEYTYTGAETEALGHTTENGVCERCEQEIGGDAPVMEEKSYSYTFTSSQFSSNTTKALNGVNWTVAGDGGYWGYDSQNGKGQQFGSAGKPYKSLTVTSASFNNVSKITVNTSGASSINGSCDVYVGETKVGTIKLTSTATAYSFDVENLTGEVKFVYTQTSSKAIYIKSIAVDYAEVVA